MNARRLQRGRSRPRARGFILLSVALALILVAAVAFLLNRSGGMNMSMAARGLESDSARYVAEAALAQINFQTQNLNCTNYTDLTTDFDDDWRFTATVNREAGSPVTFSAIATKKASGAAATLTQSNKLERKNVATYGALVLDMPLQSPDSTGKDTTLNSVDNTFNYGRYRAISASANLRALLQFDLSDIPVGSRISSATLWLYRNNASGGGGSVGLYRVTTRWTEGTENVGPSITSATFITANDTAPWSTAGGDYDPIAIDLTASAPSAGLKSWNATSLVQGWADESYPNYGMILIATGGGGGEYVSSDYIASNLERHPKLQVSYYPRCHLGPAPVILGTAGHFAILSKAGITDVPPSAINGNIGTSPITGAAITGLTCAEVTRGLIHSVDGAGPLPCSVTDPTALTTAVGYMQTAYTDAATRTAGVGSFLNVGGGTLANQTLAPGTYTWPANVTITTDLTLSGGPNDVWIFQIPGILNMTAGKVILTGGARAKNVFWQVAGGATLAAYSHLEGIVLSMTNITMADHASINGRLLAQTSVTLVKNTVTQP